jgi:hypothetical protein
MDAQQLAQAIVQATQVTHDAGATPQRRAEAVQFFEQVGGAGVCGRIEQCSLPRAVAAQGAWKSGVQQQLTIARPPPLCCCADRRWRSRHAAASHLRLSPG